MAGRLSAIVLASLVLLPVAAVAQMDPMRPPAAMAAPVNGAGPAPTSDSVVQTVILRRGAKPVAVIGGEQVTVGSRLGDARVVKITESEVVLAGPTGREVLKVNPDVEKTPSQAAVPPKSPPHKKHGEPKK